MQHLVLDRQWAVTGIDAEHQARLLQAKVLVVGAGGLGHPVLAYLATCGVHSITVLDPDRVNASNLHRQFYFGLPDVGSHKVDVLADKLNAAMGRAVVHGHAVRLTEENVEHWLNNHDVVLECTDDLAAKYRLSRACKQRNIPVIIGSADQWQGQILAVPDADAAGFDDFFPAANGTCEWGSCASNGVIGSVVGVTGSIMANEAIKLLLGLPGVQRNRIIIFDGLRGEFIYIRHSDINVNANPIIESTFDLSSMKSISYAEMLKWREEGKNFQLIDVREQYEFDEFNIGGHLIPMNTVPDHVEAFSREIPVVVHCKAGSRSANVIRFLEENHGFDNLYNLEGGLLAVR